MGTMIAVKTIEKQLDEKDKEILKLLGEGETVKRIAWKAGLKPTQVDYRIKAMKKHYNCNSLPQLLLTLHELC